MKARLRVLRAEKEWSQAELAAYVGVARGTINAIETGKYDPSVLLAFKIARAFGKNVEEVFLYQENELPARLQRVGHSDPALTLGPYTHIASEDDLQFAEQLGGILRPNAPKNENGSGVEPPKPLVVN